MVCSVYVDDLLKCSEVQWVIYPICPERCLLHKFFFLG